MRVDRWARRSQQPLENVIIPHDSHHLYLRSATPARSHQPKEVTMAFKKLALELCGTAVTPPVGCIPTPLPLLLGTHWQNDSHYGAGYHCIKLSADVLQITFHNQNTADPATNFLALHDHWAPFLSTSSIQCQLELTPDLCITWVVQNHNYLFSF